MRPKRLQPIFCTDKGRSHVHFVKPTEVYLLHRNSLAMLSPVGETWKGSEGERFVRAFLETGWSAIQFVHAVVEVRRRLTAKHGADYRISTPNEMYQILAAMKPHELACVRDGAFHRERFAPETPLAPLPNDRVQNDTKPKSKPRPTDPELQDTVPGRCGARTRHDPPRLCKRLPVPGKRRCRLHGGLSTGPRTAEGKDRVRAAVSVSNHRRRGKNYRTRNTMLAELDALMGNPNAVAEFFASGFRRQGRHVSAEDVDALAKLISRVPPEQQRGFRDIVAKYYRMLARA